MKHKWFYLLLVLLIVTIDQFSKHYMVSEFVLGESLSVNAFFNLTLVYNPGAAFGFLSDSSGWQRYFFTIVALAAVCFMVGWMWFLSVQEKLLLLALSLILSGALGNVIDRLLLGYVIDFFDFHYQYYHWPAFNVADMSIVSGVVLFLWDSIHHKKIKSNKN